MSQLAGRPSPTKQNSGPQRQWNRLRDRRSPLMRGAPALPHLTVSRLDGARILRRIAKGRAGYKIAQGAAKSGERGEVRSLGDRQIHIAIEIPPRRSLSTRRRSTSRTPAATRSSARGRPRLERPSTTHRASSSRHHEETDRARCRYPDRLQNVRCGPASRENSLAGLLRRPRLERSSRAPAAKYRQPSPLLLGGGATPEARS
jgi:hypothetical protein